MARHTKIRPISRVSGAGPDFSVSFETSMGQFPLLLKGLLLPSKNGLLSGMGLSALLYRLCCLSASGDGGASFFL
jgi:hypothetical protein